MSDSYEIPVELSQLKELTADAEVWINPRLKPDGVSYTMTIAGTFQRLIAEYEAQQRVISLAHDVVRALGGSSEILSIINSPHLGYDEMEKALREWVAQAKDVRPASADCESLLFVAQWLADREYEDCVITENVCNNHGADLRYTGGECPVAVAKRAVDNNQPR